MSIVGDAIKASKIWRGTWAEWGKLTEQEQDEYLIFGHSPSYTSRKRGMWVRGEKIGSTAPRTEGGHDE